MASFSSDTVNNGANTRHQSMYKQGVGKHVEASKERRRQATVQIRRSKKQKAIMAKRMKYSSTLISSDSMASVDMMSAEASSHNGDGSVTEVVSRLSAADTVAKATSALKALRKKLSTKSTENPGTNALSPILSDFSKTQGGTDILMKYLQQGNDEQQLEAAWCLTNLAGGDHAIAETVMPAVPYFIAFLSGSSKPLQEQALWALGNIAGDSQAFREQLFVNGALKPMVDLFARSKTPEIVQNAAWAISNLARGANTPGLPFIDCGIVEPLMDKLNSEPLQQLQGDNKYSNNIQLTIECMWIVTFLTAKEERCVHIFVNHGLLHRILAHFTTQDFKLLTPLIRSLGNILAINACPQQWLDIVLDNPEFTKHWTQLLFSNNNRVGGGGFSGAYNNALLKEAAWCTSSMTAGSEQQKQRLSNLGIIKSLAHLLKTAIFNTRCEAAAALFNYLADGNPIRVREVLFDDIDTLKSFVDMLTQPNADAAHLALNVVHIALSQSNGPQTVEAAGGMVALDQIIYDAQGVDPNLQHRATLISDEFYGNDYGEVEEPIENSFGQHQSSGGQWSFGPFNNNGNTPMNPNPNGRQGRGRSLSNQPAWMSQ